MLNRFYFFVLLLLSGCGAAPTYIEKGINETSLNSYAKIKTESENNHSNFHGYDKRVYILLIDGKHIQKYGYSPSLPQEAYILPGKREITVSYQHRGHYANACIELDVKAGDSYIVRRKLQPYGVSLWVELLDNGLVVGNLCGFTR